MKKNKKDDIVPEDLLDKQVKISKKESEIEDDQNQTKCNSSLNTPLQSEKALKKNFSQKSQTNNDYYEQLFSSHEEEFVKQKINHLNYFNRSNQHSQKKKNTHFSHKKQQFQDEDQLFQSSDLDYYAKGSKNSQRHGTFHLSKKFASDQDDDNRTVCTKTKVEKIINKQNNSQDQMFFKIYGQLIINEAQSSEESK